jgi:hypothetical protein
MTSVACSIVTTRRTFTRGRSRTHDLRDDAEQP